jgi:hypothetical protein
VEPDQVDLLAPAVLRDLQQVYHSPEARLSRELRSDVREAHRQDRIHLDSTFLHAVAVSDLDVGPRPYSDAARDVSTANSVAQALGEEHSKRAWSPGMRPTASVLVAAELDHVVMPLLDPSEDLPGDAQVEGPDAAERLVSHGRDSGEVLGHQERARCLHVITLLRNSSYAEAAGVALRSAHGLLAIGSERDRHASLLDMGALSATHHDAHRAHFLRD